MLPGPALIQADIDYQKSNLDQKIQQYVATSQGHSVELDKAFIMSIEIGLPILISVNHNKHLFSASGVTNVLNKRDC